MERADWLRLARTEGIGPVTFGHLLLRTGSIQAAIAAAPLLARRGGRKAALSVPGRDTALREVEAGARNGAVLRTMIEPEFPQALTEIDPPPPVLWIKGQPALFARPAMAIVGARNASSGGLRMARELAHGLGEAGFVVISGLARGIDAAAHTGALERGTVAVLAGGVDVIYPQENAALYAQIAERGAIVSEMPIGFAPQAQHFPRRNRLISGLARGVVVVEAALNSGSLITARYALEQNRDVFAVPGSPYDPRARGTNDLLRQGAVVTESAADVLAAFQQAPRRFADPAGDPVSAGLDPMDDADLDQVRRLVEERLSPAPTQIDELIRQCGPAACVQTILLELDLAGRLERHPGQMVSRR